MCLILLWAVAGWLQAQRVPAPTPVTGNFQTGRNLSTESKRAAKVSRCSNTGDFAAAAVVNRTVLAAAIQTTDARYNEALLLTTDIESVTQNLSGHQNVDSQNGRFRAVKRRHSSAESF